MTCLEKRGYLLFDLALGLALLLGFAFFTAFFPDLHPHVLHIV